MTFPFSKETVVGSHIEPMASPLMNFDQVYCTWYESPPVGQASDLIRKQLVTTPNFYTNEHILPSKLVL